MSALLDAALAYAADGVPVFPCHWQGPKRKSPLTDRGFKDATTDARRVRWWWRDHPKALIGAPTGRGFVVLDIDPRHGGFESLVALGFPTLPTTRTSATAGGGRHLYFAAPQVKIRNTAGERGRGIGSGLDWRGVGGYVILPAPGTGYEWISEAPLAPVPAALMPREVTTCDLAGTPGETTEMNCYAEAALLSAARNIVEAPDGAQEWTLNAEAYGIGRGVGAGWIPEAAALGVLLAAGARMPSYRTHEPWTKKQVEKKVRGAFAQGKAKPRPSPEDLEREFDRAMAVQDEFELPMAEGADAR